jgi:hypothetical protein
MVLTRPRSGVFILRVTSTREQVSAAYRHPGANGEPLVTRKLQRMGMSTNSLVSSFASE